MELELRPRRSPFDDGLSKASLATPSCCCCCCCLNALAATSAMVAADISTRTRNAGKSTSTRVGLGVLGFLAVPAALALAFGFASLWENLPIALAAFLLPFGLAYAALQHASGRPSSSSGASVGIALGITVFLAIASVLDAILAIAIIFNSDGSGDEIWWWLALIPLSLALGWFFGSASHSTSSQ